MVRAFLRIFVRMGCSTSKNIDFGADPDHDSDPGFSYGFLPLRDGRKCENCASNTINTMFRAL